MQFKPSYFITNFNTNNLQDTIFYEEHVFLSTIIPLVFIAVSTPSVTEELDKAVNQICFSLG